MIKYELENQLDNMIWRGNRSRANVSGLNYIHKSPSSNNYTRIGNPCLSYTFGLVRHWIGDKKLHLSKITEQYPQVYELAQKYIKEIKPDFEYTTITINKNICCLPHKDKYNKNNSLLISFGDFTEGGNLYVEEGDETKCYYNKDTPVIFSGNNIHYNDKPNGKRYSLVFYNLY